ncbi:hypothetical protein D0868_11352 [Hortaea werneckii]|uniref:BZIP domain-containing protein n=1 Tax=Hortaea werneckii TaxID=91943 RepID=A0A3M6XZB8_HORWE|nr:hypothetical protein D0868_11352 [Hortaea werneckii]
MAYANSRLGCQRTLPDCKHTTSNYFDDDDSAILDPAILDADIMQSPNGLHYRKDSFANSHGVLSPAESHGPSWDHHQYAGVPIDSASGNGPNVYHEESNNSFARHAPSIPHHGAAYGHQTHAPHWSLEQTSGNCTPTTGLEFMPPPPPSYEGQHYSHPRTDSVHGTFQPAPPPPPFAASHEAPGFAAAPHVQTPMSPHCHQDWMGMAQQEMDSRPMTKRMRASSPPVTMVDYARRDGIRKKNGRIEIPPERNIHTIDELIDQTTDEGLLKELKQQKRLLRNREAALASRQRKKKHTEDLEIKEKSFTGQITMLEDQIKHLSLQCQQRDEERRMLVHRYQESQRVIESLQEQMRDLKVQHNEENSKLRKKVNILTAEIEAGPAPAMSAAPSSTGFTDFNAEMEALNMGCHDWDPVFFEDLRNASPDDFSFDMRSAEPINQSPVLEKRQSSNTIVPDSHPKNKELVSEQPIATGLLFMLLLCGAFVASKPPNSQARGVLQMPAEVRAAAPTILNNLLSETGPDATPSQTISYAGHEPRPSGATHQGRNQQSRLDQMHHHITMPTKPQEIDDAFSLTTAQYASINNMNYPGYHDAPAQQHQHNAPRTKRNLAETLANLRNKEQQAGRAEVYTRSLLWDQIPTEVIKQFKEMVADQNEIDARRNQQKTDNMNDAYGSYKLEV